MTYSESAKGIRISHKRALQELDSHGIDAADREAFFAEVRTGRDGNYSATAVLNWLGY